MRKNISTIAGFLPYAYLIGISTMSFWELNGQGADLVLFGFFALYLLLGIACAILYAIYADPGKNLWVKLAAIPTDLAAVAFIVVRTVENNEAAAGGAMGVGLSIFAMIVFAIPYLIRRIAMLIAGAVVCDRNPAAMPFHTVLHLFPCIDLVSAILVHNNQQ